MQTSLRLFFLLLICHLTSGVFAQNQIPHITTFPWVENPYFEYAKPEEVGVYRESLQQLSSDIIQWVNDGELVGAELLIIKENKAISHEAFGWADKEGGRALQRNSIWNIKSMTKPFISAAILMLIEDGQLDLQDPVKKYIPGNFNDSTTIYHLLTHSSGYSGLGRTKNFVEIGEWVKDWAMEMPKFPLGKYSYSDINYAALGYIIELVSGKKAEDFIQDKLIYPLGLQNTYTTFSPSMKWAEQVASRYSYNDSTSTYTKFWKNNDDQEYDFFPAAWGIYSTAFDYAKFMKLWLNKGSVNNQQILNQEYIHAALKSHVHFSEFGLGYGWKITDYKYSEQLPFAFFQTGYEGTFAIAYPYSDAIIIFMAHTRNQYLWTLLRNSLDINNVLNEKGPYTPILSWPPSDFSSVKVDSKKLVEYEGVYKGVQPWDQSEIIFEVSVYNDALALKMNPVGENTFMTVHLIPTSDDEFIMGKVRDGEVESIGTDSFLFFKENGGTTGFEIIYEGEPVMSANRISK